MDGRIAAWDRLTARLDWGGMVHTGDERKVTFRPDVPSPARIYDYLLGGKDNYPADRKAAEDLLAAVPDARRFAQQNRSFLRRAVRYLAAEAGIRQFIDIGTGLPTQGNVHEIAQAAAPDARVVCVDNDPIVLTHGRALLHAVPNTEIIEHDLRQPAAILADTDLTNLIDLSEPVGLLLVAVLHFITDEDRPAELIRELLDGLAPGSYLVLSHATADSRPESAQGEKVYDRATTSIHSRTRDEVEAMLAGLELTEPGLVWGPQWRPDPDAKPDPDPGRSHVYVVVARKPVAQKP
jgi:SAM-dependent methyltransferase